ncbi:hypothetical protein C8R43DRAFT_1000212 [Mycena crocata]|nr:hypothetical protein C8R43DRAFT_1000212 [Mycena crocata]
MRKPLFATPSFASVQCVVSLPTSLVSAGCTVHSDRMRSYCLSPPEFKTSILHREFPSSKELSSYLIHCSIKRLPLNSVL